MAEGEQQQAKPEWQNELLSEETQKLWEEKRAQAVAHIEALEKQQGVAFDDFKRQNELEAYFAEVEDYERTKLITSILEEQEQARRVSEEQSAEVANLKAMTRNLASELKSKHPVQE
jgi:hypothetical protein